MSKSVFRVCDVTACVCVVRVRVTYVRVRVCVRV